MISREYFFSNATKLFIFFVNHTIQHFFCCLARRLEEMGITTCGEIVEVASEVLKKEFGVKTGEKLLNFAMGIDDRKVDEF